MTVDTNLSIFIISDVARHIHAALEHRASALGEHELTPEEARTRFLVEVQGDVTRAELVRRMQIDPSAAPGHSAGQGEEGLSDSRSGRDGPTGCDIVPAKGRHALPPDLAGHIREIEAVACDGLEPRDHAVLVRLLKTLRGNLRALNAHGIAAPQANLPD